MQMNIFFLLELPFPTLSFSALCPLFSQTPGVPRPSPSWRTELLKELTFTY